MIKFQKNMILSLKNNFKIKIMQLIKEWQIEKIIKNELNNLTHKKIKELQLLILLELLFLNGSYLQKYKKVLNFGVNQLIK